MRLSGIALAALAAFAGLSGAHACSSPPGKEVPSREEQFATASTVFVAHVWRTEEVQESVPRDTVVLEGTFNLKEALKGRPPENNKIQAILQFCPPIFLISGLDYLFMLDEDGRPASHGIKPILNPNELAPFRALAR